MMHPALRVATRVVSWLVPHDRREALLGDLAEEYTQRAKSQSPSSACWWYVQQLSASAASLFWFCLMETALLSTLGVALLAFLAASETQFLIRQRLSSSFPGAHAGLNLLIFIPVVALIGYFADGLRRRSALVLGLMMLAAIVPMIFEASIDSPLWLRVGWLLIGPAAAIPSFLPTRDRSRA
jgi:hypothetical protein